MSTPFNQFTTTTCVQKVLNTILAKGLFPCEVSMATHVVTISDIFLEPHLELEAKIVETGEMGFYKTNVMRKVVQGYCPFKPEIALFYNFSGELRHLTQLNKNLTEGSERIIVELERSTDTAVAYDSKNKIMERMARLRKGEWALSIDDNANSLYKTPEGMFFYSDNNDQYPLFSMWAHQTKKFATRLFTETGIPKSKNEMNKIKWAKVVLYKGLSFNIKKVPKRYRGVARRSEEYYRKLLRGSHKNKAFAVQMHNLMFDIVEDIERCATQRKKAYFKYIKAKIRLLSVFNGLLGLGFTQDVLALLSANAARKDRAIRTRRGEGNGGSIRFSWIKRNLKSTFIYGLVKNNRRYWLKDRDRGPTPVDPILINFLDKKDVKLLKRAGYFEKSAYPKHEEPRMRTALEIMEDCVFDQMHRELVSDMKFESKLAVIRWKIESETREKRTSHKMALQRYDSKLEYMYNELIWEEKEITNMATRAPTATYANSRYFKRMLRALKKSS